MYYPQNDLRKKKISEILAIAAIVLLSIDTAGTFLAQGGRCISGPENRIPETKNKRKV